MPIQVTPSQLADPIWRLSNLYKVKNKAGKVVTFRPSREQKVIIDAIYKHKLRKILILKARQLGVSTVIEYIILDKVIWENGIQAAIVDLTQGDASKKLANKIKLAWNELPIEIKEKFSILVDSGHRFQIKLANQTLANEVQAGMNARGDTFQFLHISEWGAIQFEDELRSLEIMTGALPAAEEGITVIETTWKGGKGGPLWDITRNAMETAPEDRTGEDFTLFFFPWWTDERYHSEGNAEQIDSDTNKYLDEIEVQENTTLQPSQRLWYYKNAMKLGFYRFREYPSNLEECFRGLIEGAIYQEAVLRARTEGRITTFEPAEDRLTHTFWDLGSPQNTVTWFVQFVGREIHFIDLIAEDDSPLPERVALMQSKPYHYGKHFLPHDAMAKEKSGENFAEQLTKLGMPNITVLDKPHSVWPGINHALQIFNRFHFRIPTTDRGVEALDSYRTKKNKQLAHQTSDIVHDWSSHVADPIRILAEAEQAGIFSSSHDGLVANPSSKRRKPRRRARMR